MSLLAAAAVVGTAAFVAALLERRRRDPGKKLLVVVIDVLLWPLQVLRVGWYAKDVPSVDTIFSLATRAAGTADYGLDMRWLERYRLALSPEALLGARVSPGAHLVGHVTVAKRFELKLRMRAFLKRHPAVVGVPLERPVFVVGLTRTGTTLLSRLLQQHTQLRAHYVWEQVNPIPHTHSEEPMDLAADRQRRYKEASKRLGLLLPLMNDSFKAIHEIGVDEPEECTMPCGMSMPWDLLTLPQILPLREKLQEFGARDAYSEYRKFLQLLSWQVGERAEGNVRRWLLKCPFHISFIDDLLEEFPDATLIWTHRDPAECVVSSCSLFHELRKFFFDYNSINVQELGRLVLEYSNAELTRMSDTLKSKKIRHMNVHYKDLVRDPKATVKAVWDFAGLPCDAQQEAKLDEYLEENARRRAAMSKGKSTLHAYKAEDYGLSSAAIRDTMAAYINEYHVGLNEKLT